MEVNIGEARSRTIALEDSSCIADLITCNPWGTCKFRLKSRQGGLVKIHDSEIRTDSVYKSIILSQDTTVEDTISILRNCYHREGNEEDYSLYEFCTATLTSRLLEGSEKPLEIMERWSEDSSQVFQLRKKIPKEALSPATASPLRVLNRNLVRNSILRQSIRKSNFLSSMIKDDLNRSRDSLTLSQSLEDGLADFGLARGRCSSTTSGVSSLSSGMSSLSCSSSDTLGSI